MPRMIADYQGKQITVMGLGRFGGGVGVTRFLAERGADVLVTDTLPAEALKDSIAQLADLACGSGEISYRLGEHNVSDFTTCDMVVVNPAVKPDNRFVRAALAASVPITSEIRLLVKHLPNRLRTIGITGSAGKSTTTAMTAHILRKVLGQDGTTPFGAVEELTPRRQDAKTPSKAPETERQIPGAGAGVWMGGNIGGSLLPWVEHIRDDDWVVLELSSFMLEGLRADKWSPHIAVITNISPNHLDWHGSMENYVAAKNAIFEFQHHDDVLIREPEAAWPWNLSLPGKHNAANAGLAYAAATATGWDFGNALADFRGLPHRLEFVGEYQQIHCYNDSKSTTPEAAKLAIEAFPMHNVRLILGGYDKGSDMSELAELAAERCAGVYCIGSTGRLIAEQVNACESFADAEYCDTLEAAVSKAMHDATQKGGRVLVLSPGCASWDQFANYEERGARFVALVKGYGERA